ncbi:TPA: DUF1365 domain-containing protein [Pseudomonas aeruginosa]|uniref:DUF1365 domain-containing protein n=1 Tax=Pseudomonas aeruginosa TaxID=287 RepID=UPI00030E919A|nr:DUF1365 domain-containing protein [Pseudomonas aeruginosa]
MNSCLCRGWVSHRRVLPRLHAFRYPVGMILLDLAEQPQLLQLSPLLRANRFAPLSWDERDYLPAWTSQGLPLAEAVRCLLREALGEAPTGRIELLTQLRSWGLWFNPVSFYFCHDADGRLAAILCEVRNTPWRERFHYVFAVASGAPQEFAVAKAFHVSPFLPRHMQYRMRFLIGESRVHVHMENWHEEQLMFQASLDLQRKTLDAAALRRHLLAFPWMSLRTVTAIYWQALRLLLKRIPVHDHQASVDCLSVGHIVQKESDHDRPHPERR